MNLHMGNDAEVHLAFLPISRKLMKLWKSWDSSVEMEDSEKKSSPSLIITSHNPKEIYLNYCYSNQTKEVGLQKLSCCNMKMKGSGNGLQAKVIRRIKLTRKRRLGILCFKLY